LIGLATYDGRTAAESVRDELARLKPGEFPWSEVENERQRLASLLVSCAPDGITPAKVKEKIRAMMWQKVGVEKDATGLRSALADIEQFRLDLLPRMGLKRTAPPLNYEWLEAIDAINMIDTCELIIHSSLAREESRGPFMRRDFPQTDNAVWLAANLMHRTGNGFRSERRPYELPLFKPDFVRKDNLEVAW
jgi:succinate dehydrogenase/fumarate reductase flavoprotein subunit